MARIVAASSGHMIAICYHLGSYLRLLGSYPRAPTYMCVTVASQTGMETAMMPPESMKIADMVNAAEYEILPLPSMPCYFKKNQFIARYYSPSDGDGNFYPARINTLTKGGPWVIYDDRKQHKCTDIGIDNYGKVWVFLNKKEGATASQAQERAEAAARRKEGKRKRDAAAEAAQAGRRLTSRQSAQAAQAKIDKLGEVRARMAREETSDEDDDEEEPHKDEKESDKEDDKADGDSSPVDAPVPSPPASPPSESRGSPPSESRPVEMQQPWRRIRFGPHNEHVWGFCQCPTAPYGCKNEVYHMDRSRYCDFCFYENPWDPSAHSPDGECHCDVQCGCVPTEDDSLPADEGAAEQDTEMPMMEEEPMEEEAAADEGMAVTM